jgi:hypothetical protein
VPALVIPNACVVRLIWTFNTVDTAVNVVGGIVGGGVTIGQTLANTLQTGIAGYFTSSGLGPATSNKVALRTVGIRDIRTANMGEYLGTNAGTSGTATADPLPANVAYCVTIRTSMAGRSYRGRFYVYGLTESANDTNGNPNAAVQTSCAAFVNAVGSVLSSNGITPAVLSRKLTVATAWNNAEGRLLRWNTQRRRLLAGI